MVGIYKIINNINNKIYIGQSTDIEKRHYDHKTRYKYNTHNMYLYKAIKKYGIENFTFSIIEECSIDILNEREIYWIAFYDSFNNGYNQTLGGSDAPILKGILNGNSKLTEEDIINIRNAYNNHEYKQDVYIKYEDIITINTFNDVWTGKTWKHVYYDVYNKENKLFHKTHRKPETHFANLSNNEVIEIKKEYYNGEKTLSEVYSDYSDKITYNGFKDIWYGNSYKNITIHQTENVRDKMVTNQTGSNNNHAKLTEEDVINIRISKFNNIPKIKVYESYNNIISFSGFSKVWDFKTWKHIMLN